jgi:plastocyanin
LKIAARCLPIAVGTLLALALLPSCDRKVRGESVPSAASSQAPGAILAQRPSESGSTTASSFDDALFAKVAPSTVAGQVLDGNGRPQKDVIVYIHDGLRATKYPAPGPVTVDQHDKAFQPRVLPVLVGTKVMFKNSDMVLHNVYSRSHVKTFDLGAYAHDDAKGATFEEPGRVDVFCAIHTNMHAIVLVLENPYFATTDGRGYFEIRGVPAGSYGMRIWSERAEEQEMPSEVAADRGAIMRISLR